jgi:hypothetical protein
MTYVNNFFKILSVCIFDRQTIQSLDMRLGKGIRCKHASTKPISYIFCLYKKTDAYFDLNNLPRFAFSATIKITAPTERLTRTNGAVTESSSFHGVGKMRSRKLRSSQSEFPKHEAMLQGFAPSEHIRRAMRGALFAAHEWSEAERITLRTACRAERHMDFKSLRL